jgi:hypothetical protein
VKGIFIALGFFVLSCNAADLNKREINQITKLVKKEVKTWAKRDKSIITKVLRFSISRFDEAHAVIEVVSNGETLFSIDVIRDPLKIGEVIDLRN